MEWILAHDTLDQTAEAFLKANEKCRVFMFYADMGVGKTTFIKAICKKLGVVEATSSPTFSIVNEYETPQGPIYHFDFYRLKSITEAYDMGYEEYFYSGSYCFVEWPEQIKDLIPENAARVNITVRTDGLRHITLR